MESGLVAWPDLTLLAVDLSFFGANTLEILDGGWFPLVLAPAVFTVLVTWRRGRERVLRQLKHGGLAQEPCVTHIAGHPPMRADGTAIFPASETNVASHRPGMALRRDKLFVLLVRDALPATAFSASRATV